MDGIVFDIQRFSIHDGPGIRTTVFFKGCSLRCFWCHNPESIRFKPEMQFFPDLCIGCGACLAACPNGARTLRDGVGGYDRTRCRACGACAEVCFSGATVRIGREMAADQVVAEVLADRAFYQTSGGGVTLSGGEPVLQRDFAYAILARCKAEDIHTAIETAGNYPWDDLAALLPVTDMVMMDIKHLDPDRHRAATGVSNERILENARRLARTGKPVHFRVPVVPTVNDDPEAIGAIAAFVRALADLRAVNGAREVPLSLELLAFHRLAADKYRSLALDYRAGRLEPPSKAQMAALAGVARSYGVVLQGNY
ncbi:MAG: glycyl-radical enzyme activating protein [Anaerolineae bacterium]|nr:glycyl-radical enzyme activating protein [Anaerolineae bacterium]